MLEADHTQSILLTFTDTSRLLGMSDSTLQRLLKSDPAFPKPVKLPLDRTPHRRWRRADVESYVAGLESTS